MKRHDRVLLAIFTAATAGLLGYGAYSGDRAERSRESSPSPSAASLTAPRASAQTSATPATSRKNLPATQLLSESCGTESEPACDCRQRAVLLGFDRRAPGAALEIVQASTDACQKAELLGLEAEARARNDQSEPALAEARRVLEIDPKNAYASYARGLAYQKTGKPAEAMQAAREAVKLGRGATAYVLVGLLEYQSKNFEEAEDAFEKALEVDPKSAEATFNLAVLNQRRNDYHKTREGYLKTLRLDPTHADALYNLAILTRGAGATSEAKHYVDKLSSVVGEDDPRVIRLRESLGPPDERKSALEFRVDRKKALSSPKNDD